MPRIISIASGKGGVGKTSLITTLSGILSSKNLNTCLIDFDSTQANTTYQIIGPIWTNDNYKEGICSVVAGTKEIDEVVYETKRKNLFIVPSEKINKRGMPYNIESNLSEMGIDGFTFLKDSIEKSEKLQKMDFIFIDVGPTLGQQLVASLVSADYVLLAARTESASVDAIQPTLDICNKVLRMNPHLKPLGVCISLEDKRNKKNLARAVKELEEITKINNIKLFENRISVNSNFAYLAREQKLIIDLKPVDKGAVEYEHLANEILEEIKKIEMSEISNQGEVIA